MRADDLTIAEMQLPDLSALHSLSASIGWPHRQSDWQQAMASGQGVVARDGIGRVHGSAMIFPMSKEAAAVGMTIVHPRLEATDLFHRLVDAVIDRTAGAQFFLNACADRQTPYLHHGARSQTVVHQHQGTASFSAGMFEKTHTARSDDFESIIRRDGEIYGASRGAILRPLLDCSKVRVLSRRGVLRGYALARLFGRGNLIGPVVAETEEDAIGLVAPFLRGMKGQFVRLDTRMGEGPFRQFLRSSGLTSVENVVTMTIGHHDLRQLGNVYALSGHSHG